MLDRQFKQPYLPLMALAVALLLVGKSCHSLPEPSLYNTGWVLENTNSRKVALPRSAIFLSFFHDRVWGFAGCNDIEALKGSIAYKIDDRSLKMLFSQHDLGCNDSTFEIEYLSLLQRVTLYETDGKSLKLLDESGQLLLTYRRDDQYLKLPPTLTPSKSTPIPCNQPQSNC